MLSRPLKVFILCWHYLYSSIKRFVVQPAILLPPRKNGLHFLLQMKQALTFQFGCVDRSIRHQNTWRRTRTPEIGFNPNKPISTVIRIKFYCTELSQKDLFTWKHSANKKLDKCLTICYKVWMISKCYWYNFGVLSQPFAPQNATKHCVLASRYLLKANGC